MINAYTSVQISGASSPLNVHAVLSRNQMTLVRGNCYALQPWA